jgi:hypothetical protein
VGAKETGDWAWALEQIQAGLDSATSVEQRMTLLQFEAELHVEQGVPAGAALATIEAWLEERIKDELFLAGNLHWLHSYGFTQEHDFAESARSLVAAGRVDPFNAVQSYSEAILRALIARDVPLVAEARAALSSTGSHAAVGRATGRVGDAGLDAIEGRLEAGRAGLLAGYADLGDLGATRKQALTGLIMAILLGRDPAVRSAIDESRRLFERMGAGLWLAELEAALSTAAEAPAAADAPAVPRTPSNAPDVPEAANHVG